MSSLFDGIIRDGIFASIGTCLRVVPNSGLTVAVGEGRAWFNHTWTNNDSVLVLTLGLPDAISARIDAVVLEVNSSEGVRANSIKVLQGTPNNPPANPTWTDSSNVHTYPLAYILVPVGLGTVGPEHITSMVGSTPTPYVTGPLTTIDNTAILNQWQAQFVTWFNNVRDMLDTDPAGHLQNEIDTLEGSLIERIDNKILSRQGHTTDPSWAQSGWSNFDNLGKSAIQIGNGYTITSQWGEGNFHVTFPNPFTQTPVIFLTCDSNPGFHVARVVNPSSTGFTALVYRLTPTNGDVAARIDPAASVVSANWLAIGPIA
jgi:hypothetical protein